MDFLIKFPKDVKEDTEIVSFDIISSSKVDYFRNIYLEGLHPKFKKQFVS